MIESIELAGKWAKDEFETPRPFEYDPGQGRYIFRGIAKPVAVEQEDGTISVTFEAVGQPEKIKLSLRE